MVSIRSLKRWLGQAILVETNEKRTDQLQATNNELSYQSADVDVQHLTSSSTRAKLAEDDTAKRLARIWEKLLGIDSVGLDENYFDLGGDSSLTIQLFFQIEKIFGVKLPVATLFEAPTVWELAVILSREASVQPSEHENVEHRSVLGN